MSVYYALFKDGERVKEIPPFMWPGDVAIKASVKGCKPIEDDMKKWMKKDILDRMFVSLSDRIERYRRRINNIVDEYGLMDFDEGYIIKAVHSETKEESL